MKRKTSAAIATAFKSILAKGHKPKNLHVDQGTEFYKKECKDLFIKYKIKLYSTFSGLKVTIIARFNRTLKTKIGKMFSLRGSFKWHDILQDLISEYNNSKHRKNS